MIQDEFFGQLKMHLEQQLPFVAYRKPEAVKLKAFLQSTDKLFNTESFTESGFVFSPFDSDEENVLIPVETSEQISTTIDLDQLDAKEQQVEVVNTNSAALKQQHIKLVEKGIRAIADNSFKKVVLSRVETIHFSLSDPKAGEQYPFSVFKKMLLHYPKALVYFWYHPKVGLWLGATPEMLLHVKGLRFKTMALAGTQPYDGNQNIVWDKKNTTEQKLVVNFIEEELEVVADTITVSQPETIIAGNLLHIKSDISGVLKPNVKNMQHLIFSLHPTPAVCGLPKDEAKEFILKNEGYDREFYSGFLGELNISSSKSRNTNRRNVENNAYASVNKESHLFVNLRCMQIKENKAQIYVGGGVTKASVSEKEWFETVDKTKTMLDVFL